ncbi:MAG TPA: hypothetical protein VKG81_14575 [Mycobacterium sp.]|nr:hypothetical protein [Mycobacterium sp.]
MRGMIHRLAIVIAVALAPLAFVTFVSPGVGGATVCGAGTVLDPGSDTCVPAGPPPAPPPPPAGPASMCIGAPVPFVPMSWCFPVGGG